MRNLAVIAQKGGSLKSTSVVNMAACLAGQGRGVLVIDSDVQANATYLLLHGSPPRRPTLSEVLTGDATLDEAIVTSAFPGVDLVPAEPGLADVAVQLAAEPGRERRLRSAIAELAKPYDVLLVDTGPTRSLLSTNVLNAVNEVIVPIGPGLFGFLGLNQLQADIGLVRRFLENKTVAISGVFLVLMERNNVCRDFEREMRAAFGDLVFETTIPRSVKFEESNARLTSIFDHAPKSPGAIAYSALTQEVMNRGKRKKDRSHPTNGNPGSDCAA